MMNLLINKTEASPLYRKVNNLNISGPGDPILDIKNYIVDGFEKVCDVAPQYHEQVRWDYVNQNEDVLYSDHRSWVYTICVDEQIIKIGETGNPLGIRMVKGNQPLSGTRSRLGRYRQNGDTDLVIREALEDYVHSGRVSIWARKCDIVTVPISVGNSIIETQTSYHKDLEKVFLDYIKDNLGCYPILNKGRA